ncbi:MAG: hypothetical protein IT204_07700 [Fimbriimonadaceae bacterium]|nr:hypothetical protein [Fimbriimonadaceae bacterium]
MEAFLAAQRLIFLALLGWFVSRVVVVRRPAGAPPVPRSLRWLRSAVVGGFLATFLWQAWWTFERAHSAPYRAAERYDSRTWRLRDPSDRRAVVDRWGRPLIRTVRFGGQAVRRYELGPAAAHVSGYFHRLYGRAGLEEACDDRLATWRQPAWEQLSEAAQQAANPQPLPLALTIDRALQQAAATALGSRRGAVVVLNPAAGDLLALVSSPCYDPNLVDAARYRQWQADPDRPLLNRALAGLYPPGSTFKPVVAAAALATTWDPATRYESGPAGYLPPFERQRIRDHEAGERAGWRGHGPLDLRQAMACSANTWFAALGVALGPAPIVRTAQALGWQERWRLAGRADLVALPGRLPSDRLRPGDTARLAIGQHELLITPLGLAQVAATLANYGRQVPPRLLLDQPVPAPRQVLEAGLATRLNSLLQAPVADRGGTARGLRLPGVAVAGKTGSAQNPHGRAHAWVLAYAPAERATVVVVVLVEQGGSGSAAAVPVARAVLLAARQAGYLEAAR